jgi:hypothetical protein
MRIQISGIKTTKYYPDIFRPILNGENPRETARRFFEANHISFYEPITYRLWFENTGLTRDDWFFAIEELITKNLGDIIYIKNKYSVKVVE